MAKAGAETATRHKPKTHFEKRATAAMEEHLPTPEWSVRQKLALTARMLAARDHSSGLAGQITARGEAPGTMWTARFGLGLEEVRRGNQLETCASIRMRRGKAAARNVGRA